jgi:hypothetical protein
VYIVYTISDAQCPTRALHVRARAPQAPQPYACYTRTIRVLAASDTHAILRLAPLLPYSFLLTAAAYTHTSRSTQCAARNAQHASRGPTQPQSHPLTTAHATIDLTRSGLSLAEAHYLTAHRSYFELHFLPSDATRISDALDVCFPILGFGAAMLFQPLLSMRPCARAARPRATNLGFTPRLCPAPAVASAVCLPQRPHTRRAFARS